MRARSAFPPFPATAKNECAYAGLSRTWRFLPSDSLTTPSGVRSASLSINFSSVIAAQTAPLDLAARLAVRRHQAGLDEQRQHAGAGFELGTGNLYRRQVFI